VLFKAGTYRFTAGVPFAAADSGNANNPIVYRSAPGETAFFDGGRVISRQGFSKVSGSLANRLTSAAQGNVWSKVISDQTTIQLLSHAQNGLTLNNALLRPTQTPNVGYLNIQQEFSSGAFVLH